MQETQEMQVQSLGQENPWKRKWQPTPEFLPGKFHGQRSLAGYSLWGHKESDMTEVIITFYKHNHGKQKETRVRKMEWGSMIMVIFKLWLHM